MVVRMLVLVHKLHKLLRKIQLVRLNKTVKQCNKIWLVKMLVRVLVPDKPNLLVLVHKPHKLLRKIQLLRLHKMVRQWVNKWQIAMAQ